MLSRLPGLIAPNINEAHPATRFTRVSQQRCFFYDKKDQSKWLKYIKELLGINGSGIAGGNTEELGDNISWGLQCWIIVAIIV